MVLGYDEVAYERCGDEARRCEDVGEGVDVLAGESERQAVADAFTGLQVGRTGRWAGCARLGLVVGDRFWSRGSCRAGVWGGI